jgi:hypothetical protein
MANITIRLFLHLEYRNFSSIGQANYLPSNGHYRSLFRIDYWTAAILAENTLYYGLQDVLATITSADEAKISGETPQSRMDWRKDAATEGVWKWVTGPEGLANGGTGTTGMGLLMVHQPPYNFALWNTADQYGAQGTRSAHITAPGVGITGSWNDLTNTGILPEIINLRVTLSWRNGWRSF